MNSRTAVVWLAVVMSGFGLFLRAWGLENNPPGLWQDEASTGLDAFLIFQNGQDQTGVRWPMIFRSFGDYPLGLYRYLAAPVVGLLGLSAGTERLVAAASGSLLLVLTGLLVRDRYGNWAGIGAWVSGALCPFWIHFSRYGSEAILLPTCLTAAWYAVEKSKKDPRWLWVAGAAFGLTAHTYHAAKVVLPLFGIVFLWSQWAYARKLWSGPARKHLMASALIFSVLVIPAAAAAFSPEGQARGRTVLAWHHAEGSTVLRLVIDNYLSYFSLPLLFGRGGPAMAQSVPGLGLFNWLDAPFLLLGLFRMARRRERTDGLLLFWLALGPLPGGLTYEAQNVGRAIAWLPAPAIVSGIGLSQLADFVRARQQHQRAWVLGLATVGVLACLGTAWRVAEKTLVVYPRIAQRHWQFEVSRALACAVRHRSVERVVVSPAFPQSSVFARFYFEPLQRSGEPKIWRLGRRIRVPRGELYVAPHTEKLPEGIPVCTIREPSGPKPLAYVFASLDSSPGNSRLRRPSTQATVSEP
jgi:hypothetical protein